MDEVIAREIVERSGRGEKFAIGLLAHVQGSAPQRAGARLIVLPDGTMRGTVGGGCLEMETRRHALIALRTGEPSFFDLRLDDDFGWDDGLICGGRTTLLVSPHPERAADALATVLAEREKGSRALLATVLAAPDASQVGRSVAFPAEGGVLPPIAVAPLPDERPVISDGPNGWKVVVESLRPNPRLVVMGCGHIGLALVEMAAGLGFDVTAVDDRPDYAASERLPGARKVVCEDLPTAAGTLPTSLDTYWVVVTRGHRNDGRVLASLINRPAAYVGMIGSRRKVRLIREGILNDRIATGEQLDRIHSPIGLDIGAESPREIALAIAAEIVAVRRGKRS